MYQSSSRTAPYHAAIIFLFTIIIFTDQMSPGSALPNDYGGSRSAAAMNDHSAMFNVSVTLIQGYPPSIRVSWNYYTNGSNVSKRLNGTSTATYPQSAVPSNNNHDHDGTIGSDHGSRIKTFQVSYHPIFSRFRQIFEVPPFIKNVTLEHLIPNQEYKLEISAITESSHRINSQVIRFITPPNEYRFGRFKGLKTEHLYRSGNEAKGISIKMDEAVIVVFVLCFWMAVIALFCNKWGKIRHLEPYHPEYKEEPEPEPFPSPVYSIHHPKPSRMNTCTSSNVGANYAMATIGHGSRTNLSSFDKRRTCSQGSRFGSLYQCGSACVYSGTNIPMYQGGTADRTRQQSFCGQMAPGQSLLSASPMRIRNNSTICIQQERPGSEFGTRTLKTHRGSCMMLSPNIVLSDTRRIKSAEDIKSLVIQSLKASSKNHFRFPLGTLDKHNMLTNKRRVPLKKCGAIDFSR